MVVMACCAVMSSRLIRILPASAWIVRCLDGGERNLLISVLRVAIQHKFHGNIPPIIFVKRHPAHELAGNFAHLPPHLQKEIE